MNRNQYRYRIFLSGLLGLVLFMLFAVTINGNAAPKNERPVLADKRSNEAVSFEETETRSSAANQNVKMVIPSGEPIGIYVKADGVMVIDIGYVKGEDENPYSPCREALKKGDYILSVNQVAVNDKDDLINMINTYEGEPLKFEIRRGLETLCVDITPVYSKSGCYMIGLWVKDDISGIGTLTYVDSTGFGALGHSINDNDTGEVFDISDGAIYGATLLGIVKSNNGRPGRLEGMIDYSATNIIGRVSQNGTFGIAGNMTGLGKELYSKRQWMEVANKAEAHLGEAYILSYISGEAVYYTINITGIDLSEKSVNKGLEIQITDERLLEKAGGIVQGMSGTPIIQDGKLLGAITHVFLKDSTKGYGTFVELMMGD